MALIPAEDKESLKQAIDPYISNSEPAAGLDMEKVPKELPWRHEGQRDGNVASEG
jgi:hypothetical protein